MPGCILTSGCRTGRRHDSPVGPYMPVGQILRGRVVMTQLRQFSLTLLAFAAMLISMLAVYLNAQTSYPPPNEGLPNPYRAIPNWAKLPDGRSWGATAGVAVAPNNNVWAV